MSRSRRRIIHHTTGRCFGPDYRRPRDLSEACVSTLAARVIELATLADPPLTVAQVADRLAMSPSNVSSIIRDAAAALCYARRKAPAKLTAADWRDYLRQACGQANDGA